MAVADGQLEGLRARFDADAGDVRAFEALEEALFVGGDWPALVALYGRRLDAPDLGAEQAPKARARLRMRQAQVLEERCLKLDDACEAYHDAIALDPSLRPAFVQLRRIYTERNQWDLALQLAEVEEGLPMRPFERAGFATEMGRIWLRQLGDADQALPWFERALEADPSHVDALLAMASAHKRQGRDRDAARRLREAANLLRGAERAAIWVRLARLTRDRLGDAAAAVEIYRRALSDDPMNRDALEAIAEFALTEGQLDLYEELQERRFGLAEVDIDRLAIAHDAGRMHLEDRRDPEKARHWFDRALELFPEDPVVHLYLADIARETGDTAQLARHLDEAAVLADDATPVEVLEESAGLASQRGDADLAVAQLRRALDREPARTDLLESLAKALQRGGRHEELTETLEQLVAATAEDPQQHAQALVRLGTHHEEVLQDADAAFAALDRAAELAPASPSVIASLERLLRKEERWEALRDHLDRSAESVTEDPVLAANLRVGLGELWLDAFDDATRARSCFDAALAIDGEHPRARQGLERIALATGDDETLLASFDAESHSCRDPERLTFVVTELARIRESREELDAALGAFDRLLDLVPEHGFALAQRVRLLGVLERPAEQAEALERQVPLLQGRERVDALDALGAAHEAAGNPDAALTACERTLLADEAHLESARRQVRLLEALDRPEALASALAQRASLEDERVSTGLLDQLARLQAGTLSQPEAALATLEEVGMREGAPNDVDLRITELLEQLERFDALEAHLEKRRAALDPLDPAAFELDLRRAEILQDELQRGSEAIPLFELAREAQPRSERALDGLERALRFAGDHEKLVALLAERAEHEADATRRAEIELERATVLEGSLSQLPEAKIVLAELADGGGDTARVAAERLEGLLEQSQDFGALRARWSARIEDADDEETLSLHRRLATLCRDRLQQPDAAALHLEAAARQAPDDGSLWQALAALHDAAGRDDDLARVLDAELATQPDDDRRLAIHAQLARLHQTRGATDSAETHYRAVLELDPEFESAVAFIAARCEADGRAEELRTLWREQLERRQDDASAAVAIRLRLAELSRDALDDPEDAIAVLEPAAEDEATLAVVAEPLAALYTTQGHSTPLLALCERVTQVLPAGDERAAWWMRMADAHRNAGEHGRAADALRRVLADRPTDRSAQSLLRGCYRELGEHEPLLRLLEAELAQVGGSPEIPLRREIAELLAGSLGRADDAVVHLQRMLELDPNAGDVRATAIDVCEAAGDHAAALAFLDQALDRARDPERRAALELRRMALLDAAGRSDEATVAIERASDAAPAHAGLRATLRARYEDANDGARLLRVLENELASGDLDDAARRACIAQAATIAEELGDDTAALRWLARLERDAEGDPGAWLRIAAVMRSKGDRPGLIHALEEAAARHTDASERVALRRERAGLFEADGANGRAIEALEAALADAPTDPELLGALERLTRTSGNVRRRLEILEIQLAEAGAAASIELRREAAALCDRLGETERASALRWEALGADTQGVERVELLRGLGDTLRREGRPELWARVAEEELRHLDPDAPVFQERLRTLHRDLARGYAGELNRPDAAIAHWSRLLDQRLVEAGTADHEEAEGALLALLRATRSSLDLEARLGDRLARDPESIPQELRCELWLELGRLRREQLHRPGAAAHAFREALAVDDRSLPALRGLRGVAEQLGRMSEVADTLDQELALSSDAPASARAALHRRLGEIAWHDLDSTTRASRAFASALEAEPGDLLSLRSLQQLFETMEDWRGALDLYESEVEVLGEDEPERRQAVWLRAGELARDRSDEPERALRAFESAAAIAALAPARQAEWAELYDRLDQPERFAEVYGAWIDAPDSGAGTPERLRLASVLESLGRRDAALARAEQAAETGRGSDAWDEVARLREALGRPADAADALATAARACDGGAAADRWFRAATLRRADAAMQSLEDLEQAIAADPSHAAAQARLARAAFQQGRLAQAERAALATLALGDDAVHPDAMLDMALAGARAARAQEHLDPAAKLLGAALKIAPEHPEALSAQAELLVEMGDLGAARQILERRLALDGHDEDRATHLTLLGRCLASAGEDEGARMRFEEAVSLDPSHDDAHAALCELLVRTDTGADAVHALERWAAGATDPTDRATRLFQAAEIELAQSGREEPAESLLREAIAADAELPGVHGLLCDLLWSSGRASEAGDAAARALATVAAPGERARILLVQARAAEQRGDARCAAEAYAEACTVNPRASEAALSGARLLRGLGEWREAADLLQRYVERAPKGAGTAAVLHQLGRLLAGPLEDVPGAVAVYRQALEADGALGDAREALADLLVHRPEGWDEAIDRHRELLDGNPVRLASLRGLLRIARGQGNEIAISSGLAILRGLGAATPEERSEAPVRLATPVRRRQLADPIFEAARKVCEECAGEMAEALGGGPPAAVDVESPDPVARFRALATAAEARLAAPALVPLATEELASVVQLTVQLACEAEGVSGDGNLVNGLSAALGRRAKRRVRKALGEIQPEQIVEIDFDAWRAELRALASVVALEDGELEIRSGFLAWLHAADPDGARHIGDDGDLRELVAARPETRALLRRLTETWVSTL